MAETSPHHGNKWMPILYATYFGILQGIAHRHGYALAVHGSFTRDMDLIAVPWIDTPSPPLEMLQEMNAAVGLTDSEGGLTFSNVAQKPHGRTAYAMLTGGGGYVDISVINPTA